MLHRLIEWALNNPLIVILLAVALLGVGVYSFRNVNVEAYPDPAPAIVEVVAQFPGASAEEVERQVTIPLEVDPGRHAGPEVRRAAKSLFGLSHHAHPVRVRRRITTRPGRKSSTALQFTQPLPPGVTPQISPESPTGEIFRYTLNCSQGRRGQDIYTLNDLKALQDWVLEREFRRVPRIVDVTSCGGTVKRYEIHPDPDRLQALRHHLGAAADRPGQRQRQRRRRLRHPGRRGHERAQRRPVRRRRRPGQSGAGHERPRPGGRRGAAAGRESGSSDADAVEASFSADGWPPPPPPSFARRRASRIREIRTTWSSSRSTTGHP